MEHLYLHRCARISHTLSFATGFSLIRNHIFAIGLKAKLSFLDFCVVLASMWAGTNVRAQFLLYS
jgi:hypothetical protein